MPTSKTDPTLKRYAYFILDVLREQREGTEGTNYTPAALEPGMLKVESKNHGTGTHTFTEEDGPFVFTMTGVYICTGKWNAELDRVDFDYGALRLLNLVMMGAQGEQILAQRLHEVVDHCKAIVEENLEQTPPGSLEHILRDLDRFEKSNYRKH